MINAKKKRIQKRYIIMIGIVIIIIIFVILYYTVNEKRNLNKVESFLKDGITSVQKVVMFPIQYIENKFSDFGKLDDVLKENDVLEDKVNRISLLESENTELKKEIENLKKELNITNVLSDYEYINATVITRNVSYWYNTLSIDKGKKDGIKDGMVVVNSSGIVGKISNATNNTSDVKLITANDTNNKISVSIISGDNKLNGVINGYNYDNKTATVEGISNTDNVTAGDLVYTSGLGGVFPAGILVGTVADIKTDSYDLSKIISVTLSANFDDINYVAVLRRKSDS